MIRLASAARTSVRNRSASAVRTRLPSARERVVAASLVIEIGGGPSRGLGEELVGEQAADVPVQPARLETYGPTGSLGNVEHDPVPMPFAGGDGHEDQELDGLERQKRVWRGRRWRLWHIGVVTICNLTVVGGEWL